MNTEYFIARRMACGADGRGVMVRIATLSVAMGMAVMILALAVIMGFKREVTHRVVGFAAHVQVTDVRGVESPVADPVLRSEALEALIRTTDGFVRMWPYAMKEGIAKTPDGVRGVLLKGVDGEFDFSFFEESLVDGELPCVGDSLRTKELLISRTAADALMLGVGDKVEILFAGDEQFLHRDRFRICGIYATGMEEMDAAVMLTDLRNVQRLAHYSSDEVSGYEVMTQNFAASDPFAADLSHELLYSDLENARNVVAISVAQRYPSIFDWLRAHDVNAAVVIAIMLVVAFFNMSTALLILVFERVRTIGLLKAMGMRDGAVQRIFLWRAVFITLRGVVWGNVAGIGLCLMQQYFHIIKLSSEGYLLSEVPIALGWGWWLALNAGAMALIVVLLVLPARVASSVKPSEAIRYE